MTELLVVEELRDYLVAQGVGEAWATATGALPAIVMDPRDGAPNPTTHLPLGKDVYADEVVTLVRRSGVPFPDVRMEAFLEESIVDVICKARTSPRCEVVQRQIRRLLADRVGWTMGALRVEWSRVYAGDVVVPTPAASWYVRVQSFTIRARTLSLAGLPYA